MFRFVLIGGLCAALSVLAPSSAPAGFVLGVNLIENGNAEAGAGSPAGFTVVPVPNFSTFGNFTVVQYTAGGGFPTPTDPGPVNRGTNFFAGGPSNGSSSALQNINIADGAATVDAGGVTLNLSGFLGGFSTQGDNAVLTATFLNGVGSSLGAASIGPVSSADRAGATGLLFRTTNGSVPVGTRSIDVSLRMVRTAGDYNDGYADNLALILSNGPTLATPAPASVIVFAVASVGFGVWTRRNRGTAV